MGLNILAYEPRYPREGGVGNVKRVRCICFVTRASSLVEGFCCGIAKMLTRFLYESVEKRKDGKEKKNEVVLSSKSIYHFFITPSKSSIQSSFMFTPSPPSTPNNTGFSLLVFFPLPSARPVKHSIIQSPPLSYISSIARGAQFSTNSNAYLAPT